MLSKILVFGSEGVFSVSGKIVEGGLMTVEGFPDDMNFRMRYEIRGYFQLVFAQRLY